MATIEQKIAQAKEMKERDEKIWQDFCNLKRDYPQANVSSIFETLAMRYRTANKRMKRKLYPSSSMGVRNILIRNNQYQPKSRLKDYGDSNVQQL